MLGISADRGDTIIEVLLAITIFSMVSIGAMTIMNQGTNASQRALEITLVRQEIDAQAEALRAAQQAYTSNPEAATWAEIAQPTPSGGFDEEGTCPAGPADIDDSFIMDTRTATKALGSWFKPIDDGTDVDTTPYAKVRYESGEPRAYSMWIERTFHNSSAATVPDSYEFIVKACWYGAGLSVPLHIETSVRLYDPS